jgi:hypothetical protein
MLPLPRGLTQFHSLQCPQKERCHLRAACKVLQEHADPIVFRCLYLRYRPRPHIIEHQIMTLASRASRACEFTRDLVLFYIPGGLRITELSRPHFGRCDDLRIHLPAAISALSNMVSFRSVTVISTLDDERYPIYSNCQMGYD